MKPQLAAGRQPTGLELLVCALSSPASWSASFLGTRGAPCGPQGGLMRRHLRFLQATLDTGKGLFLPSPEACEVRPETQPAYSCRTASGPGCPRRWVCEERAHPPRPPFGARGSGRNTRASFPFSDAYWRGEEEGGLPSPLELLRANTLQSHSKGRVAAGAEEMLVPGRQETCTVSYLK